LLKHLANGAGIGFTLEAGEDCTVMLAHTDMHQVLTNLVSNARDAVNGEGKIEVRTYEERGGVAARPGEEAGRWGYVQVKDSGPGMSPNVAARVFDPYFTTKGASQGTGLGLATVRSIVGRNHGRIALDSNEQHGTTVTVGFPVTENEHGNLSFDR
jgi:signal transduction histidine kinase